MTSMKKIIIPFLFCSFPLLVQATDFEEAKKNIKCPIGEVLTEGVSSSFLSIMCIDKENRRHGPFYIYYPSGGKFSSAFYQHGVSDGEHEAWHENGLMRERAYFRKGKRHGKIESWYNDGIKSVEENYAYGYRHGPSKRWYHNAQLVSEEIYQWGKLNGSTKRWNVEGVLMESSSYKNGQYDGDVISYDKGNVSSFDQYKDGRLHGDSRRYSLETGKFLEKSVYSYGRLKSTSEWYENGNPLLEKNYRCPWRRKKDCVQDGVSKIWLENGQLYKEAHYRKGQKHGIYRTYNEQGVLRDREDYKDDELHGSYQSYHDNGQQLIQEFHKNGNLSGDANAWYSNGKKMYTYHYDKGKEDGALLNYFDNGQLAMKSFFDRGRPIGIWERFHRNGKKHTVGTYENGLRVGTWNEWHENEQQKSQYHYQDGLMEGAFRQWDEKGVLVEERLYSKGKWNDQEIGEDLRADARLKPGRVAWIAFELVDLDGLPITGSAYECILPDGEVRKGKSDAIGKVILESVAEGMAEIDFPEESNVVKRY
jgi:antitoxin component YwqK of YwqJK toxin-antitoxin module